MDYKFDTVYNAKNRIDIKLGLKRKPSSSGIKKTSLMYQDQNYKEPNNIYP